MTRDLEHVARAALPWRDECLTECGISAEGRPVLSRDAFVAKVKREGQQRSALTTCMTCWHTAAKYKPWAEDPVQALAREVNAAQWGADERSVRMRAELWAIEALIRAHRDEFDGYLSGLDSVPRLSDRRGVKRRGA